MKTYVQLSFEEVSLNRIRSIFKTLDNYRRTSMLLHNRHTPSVRAYALQRGDEVAAIAANFPENAEIQRWARKFKEYMEQHNLSNEIQE